MCGPEIEGKILEKQKLPPQKGAGKYKKLAASICSGGDSRDEAST
jgi:hypothetical protein